MKQFLVQNSGITYHHTNRLIERLNARRIPWKGFGILPFCSEITGIDYCYMGHDSVVYGGTKLLDIFYNDSKHNVNDIFPWYSISNDEREREILFDYMKNGISYNPRNFDQAYYTTLPSVNDLLLNADAETAEFSTELLETYFDEVFIKPGPDGKFFNAGVVQGMTLREHLDKTQILSNLYERIGTFDVVIAPIKKTIFEWRFYIINGRIATASQYFAHGSVKHDKYVPQEAYEIAELFRKKYQPHEKNYVMDIALTDKKEYKIVEFNCINCSGLYHCDIDKYIDAFIER